MNLNLKEVTDDYEEYMEMSKEANLLLHSITEGLRKNDGNILFDFTYCTENQRIARWGSAEEKAILKRKENELYATIRERLGQFRYDQLKLKLDKIEAKYSELMAGIAFGDYESSPFEDFLRIVIRTLERVQPSCNQKEAP